MNSTLGVVVCAAVLALTGCSFTSSPTPSPTRTPTSTPTPTPTPTPSPSPTPTEAAYQLGEELPPGTYTSVVFATPVTFTVPDGWKVFEDEPGHIGLARIANDGPPLLVMRDIDAASKDCAEKPEPNVGRTPQQLAVWLTEHEGLVTSDPTPTSVGGLDGYTLDTAMDPSWSAVCPFSDGQPIAMTLVGSELSRGVHWGNDRSWHDRLWLLDLPNVDKGNIVIVGTVCCGVDDEDQLPAVQGVVDSFSFDTTTE